jgi:enoyl-[acyl-carrier protein] reductase/trans-2-enoyl-CoA reductase (NAD+)
MGATARISNGVCLDVDPAGCERLVLEQIQAMGRMTRLGKGPRSVLVLGASGGYGLSARIVSAFGIGAPTMGVSLERAPCEKRGGSPGWYTNIAFDTAAKQAGLKSLTLQGDAFSEATKDLVVQAVREHQFEPFDLVVYSLASPVRTDPETGVMHRTTIKPIGHTTEALSLNLATGQLKQSTLTPATEEEAAGTIKVMGGEDWKLWISKLHAAGVLAPGVKTVAFSYIGPAITNDIYRSGTLGRAKAHLEATAHELTSLLKPSRGKAHVAVCKAVVTRASAVIPAMPLYIAVLFRVMKDMGLHEDCFAQINRLFRDRLYTDGDILVDSEGRIRIDDWELRDDVQKKVLEIYKIVNNENVWAITDFDGYQHDFLALHGLKG